MVFDISFADFTIQKFVGLVLRQILDNRILKNSYRYYYLSLTNYSPTYKSKVSVLFDIGNPEDAFELEKLLKDVAEAVGVQHLAVDIIYPKESNINKDFEAEIEVLNDTLSRLHTLTLKNTEYLEDRLLLAISFSLVFFEALQLDAKDFLAANDYLKKDGCFLEENSVRLLLSNK